MSALWLPIWTLVIVFFVPAFSESVCNQCNSPVTERTKVIQYCLDSNLTLTTNQRCCLANATTSDISNADIVGLDMSHCSLHNVTGLFRNMVSVVVITLDENPLKSVADDDFYQLAKLETLVLPVDVGRCPGGADVWNTSKSVNNTWLCEIQIDSCQTVENNDTCPAHKSYCSPAGPGLVDCLCSPGYHGYKCLRKGEFAVIPFVGGICGSTVVAAAILWITQRRFVIKGKQ